MTYENFYCDSETLTGLRGVLRRLYDDRPLKGDDRRDLANRMDALLGHIDQMPVKDQRPSPLYQKIEKVARGIVTNHWSDVEDHDKMTLARMKKGDQLLWACRYYGSHIAWLVWSDVDTTRSVFQRVTMNESVFQSANKNWPGMQWYLLTATSDDGRGTMVKISVEEGARLFADRITETA